MKRITTYLYDNTEYLLILFAIIFSLVSFSFFFNHHLITAYSDAKAHLNIARRVFDNLTPGFAQLGGVWLPLLHILMLPTIWNDFMWHSGLAGSIVNMPMYILSIYLIYKTIFLITEKISLACIGALLMGLNANYLYIQATPMTEALFVATLSASAYFLTLWAKTQKISHLLFAAIAFFLSGFNRYEGWPTAMCGVLIILVISLLLNKRKEAESNLILFSTVAFFSVAIWLLWQLAIFHDPIYFLNSEFSAKTQTEFSITTGGDLAYNNIKNSLLVFYYTLVHICGFIAVVMAGIGLLLFFGDLLLALARKQKNILLSYLPVFILFVPGVFLIYALYKGNIPVDVPEIHEPGHIYFNVRYGLYSLPAIAFLVARVAKIKWASIFVILLILINCGQLFLQGNAIATVQDATGGKPATVDDGYKYWADKYYHGGYILVSAGTSDPIIFDTGLDMKDFISEGSGQYWIASIKNPAQYAEWVILSASPRDSIRAHFNMKKITEEFTPRYTFNGFTFLQRR